MRYGTDHRAFLTARAAVELLLRLGRESYRPDILASESNALVSPLAGQELATEVVEGMCVGPAGDDAALHHVTMILACNGHEVEAYSSVTSSNGRIIMMEVSVYVDGNYVVRRNVSVDRAGVLKPWGTPDVPSQ